MRIPPLEHGIALKVICLRAGNIGNYLDVGGMALLIFLLIVTFRTLAINSWLDVYCVRLES